MISIARFGLTLLVAGAAVTTVAAVRGRGAAEPADQAPVAARDQGLEVVHAQAFHLDEPATHWWRAERPTYDAGWILVVRANPELLVVRQTHNPMLLVGEEVAEKVNDGSASGYGVFLVPSPAGADLQPTLDLASAPIAFVDPKILPEQMTLADVKVELARAVTRGAAPAAKAEVARAVERGGGAIFLEDAHQLRVHVANAIERWSPDEVDLVSGLRAPLVQAH